MEEKEEKKREDADDLSWLPLSITAVMMMITTIHCQSHLRCAVASIAKQLVPFNG